METVGQCLWIKPNPNDYYNFVADQICNLTRYGSVILTDGERHNPGYHSLTTYAPLNHDIFRPKRVATRVAAKVLGYPWLFSPAIRSFNIKLLHAHFAPYGIMFLPVAKKLQLPLITSFHGYDASSFALNQNNLNDLRQLFRHGELFTVVSDVMKRDLVGLGCPPEKIIVHHVGVDVNSFRPHYRTMPEEFPVILTVCKFQEKKGLPYLVRAINVVRREFPKVQLRIIGDDFGGDSSRQEVERLLNELDLHGNVVLAGYKMRMDLIEEYVRAHLFALPSITARNGDKEGIPTVIMEAHASGLPVISTHHSGIPEVVHDGETGYLVPERNVEQLAEKICLLIRNPQRRVEMGRMGRAHIEREFNLANQIPKLDGIYDRLIQ